MDNVSMFGETKHRITFEYLLELEEQLKIVELRGGYQEPSIRALKMKIKLLRKRLTRYPSTKILFK